MPRLIPQRAKHEELFVATKTLFSDSSMDVLKPLIVRGEVVLRSDPRMKRHPEAFEEAPQGVVRGPAPRPNETVAIAQAMFIAFDGKWVWPGTRLHPYDGIVRAHPQFFWTEVPRD
jgi:hypothetical protein